MVLRWLFFAILGCFKSANYRNVDEQQVSPTIADNKIELTINGTLGEEICSQSQSNALVVASYGGKEIGRTVVSYSSTEPNFSFCVTIPVSNIFGEIMIAVYHADSEVQDKPVEQDQTALAECKGQLLKIFKLKEPYTFKLETSQQLKKLTVQAKEIPASREFYLTIKSSVGSNLSNISIKIANGNTNVSYTTNPLANNMGPNWSVSLPVQTNGSMDVDNLIVEVSQKKTMLGKWELSLIDEKISVRRLIPKPSKGCNWDLHVNSTPTFLDAISNEFGLLGAFDVSAKHLGDGRLSFLQKHEKVIKDVWMDLRQFTNDVHIPTWFFGEKPKVDGVKSSSVDISNHELVVINSLMEAYDTALQSVTPYYEGSLSDVITKASSFVDKCGNFNKYYIFLIITNGHLDDVGETIRSLLDVSKKRLSFAIVDFGNDQSYSDLKVQLNNENLLRNSVCFIQHREPNMSQCMTEKIWQDIHRHLCTYMVHNSIKGSQKVLGRR